MSVHNVNSWNETQQGLELVHPQQGLELVHPSDPLGNLGSDKVVVQSTPDKYLSHLGDPLGAYGATKGDAIAVEKGNDAGLAQDVPQKPWFRQRKWVIIAGVGLLVVILAAVLGGVLGTKKSGTSTPSATPSSTSTSPSSTPTSSSGTTFHYTGNIVAASFPWNESGGGTRVYYQDNKNELIEAATQDNKTWTNTKLGVFPQNGSALAAATSRMGYGMVR